MPAIDGRGARRLGGHDLGDPAALLAREVHELAGAAGGHDRVDAAVDDMPDDSAQSGLVDVTPVGRERGRDGRDDAVEALRVWAYAWPFRSQGSRIDSTQGLSALLPGRAGTPEGRPDRAGVRAELCGDDLDAVQRHHRDAAGRAPGAPAR